MSKCILVTGGAGYIGSHCVVELITAGYNVVVVDNLCNSSIDCIKRIEEITSQKVVCHVIDLLNKGALRSVFSQHDISCVIHLAGLKAVATSTKTPLTYYQNNVTGTLNLLEVMEMYDVRNFVFSSSASVYGASSDSRNMKEEHPVGACTNPYGRTKYFVENILQDLCTAEKKWNAISLRYFNPVGAHKSGKIGEDPLGVPMNLMPFIAQVVVGRRPAVRVYGADYNTHDGTGVRDYIHVMDLAEGHVAALKKLDEKCGYKVYNLGTGKGYSVLQIIKGVERASGRQIPYTVEPRRPGDVDEMGADPSLAWQELSWRAKRGLDEMCEDIWRWQSMNPNGYATQSDIILTPMESKVTTPAGHLNDARKLLNEV